jgi:hypothetical protein
MKKTFLLAVALSSLLFISLTVCAQTTSFIARVNVGVGVKYNRLYYYDSPSAFSPGGGAGLELGFRHALLNHIEPYATVAYQQNIALGYDSENYEGIESSYFFSRFTFNTGLNYKFVLKPESTKWLRLGAGINYSLPGDAKLKEENFSYPRVKYQNASGYHIEASYQVYNTNKVTVEAGLRYRNITFKATRTSADTPLDLTPAQASGFDLSLIFGLNL